MAAPVIQSHQTNTGTSNSATCNKPSGVVSGDLLIAVVDIEGGSNTTVTPPAGWTAVLAADNSSNVGLRTYRRKADGTEGASFSFGLSSSVKWCAGIARIDGYDDELPINVSAAGNGASGNPTSPAVTTTVADCLILRFVTNKKPATYTTPANHSEQWDAPNTGGGLPSNALMYRTWASASSTGTQSITASETAEWAAVTLAIAPVSNRPRVTTGTSSTTGASVTSLTWSHTVPSGSNRVLVVGVSIRNSADLVTDVTFGGVSLTRQGMGTTGFSGALGYIYSLTAPTVSTADIVVTFSSSVVHAEGAGINLINVHQDTPFGTAVTGGQGLVSSSSLVVSSVNTELVLDVISIIRSSAASLAVGADQTERINIINATVHGIGMSTELGAASTTMSWTLGSSSNWSGVALAIKPATVATITVKRLSALGVG